MSIAAQIGGSGTLFVGEDKVVELELLTPTSMVNGVPLFDANSVPIDMTGWAVQFIVRLRDNAPDPPIFSKAAAVVGVYNAVRATNTQRATVQLNAVADMETVKAKTYRQSWKRLDAGNETVLENGPFVVEVATNY